MLGLFKKKKKPLKEFYSVVDGKSIDLSEVQDEMFSKKTLGDGIAVIPSSDDIVSPCSGEVTMVAATKHAVAIENEDGVQVLIHIGLDSVKLNGEGFKIFCKEGDRVEVGTLLVKIDRELFKKEKISDTVIMILVEQNGHEIINRNTGENIKAGESR
jgi:sugar PTS system EIIA component